MSRVTRIICDNCNRQLGESESYYIARVANTVAGCDKAAQIVDGDYCEKCFTDIMKKEIRE